MHPMTQAKIRIENVTYSYGGTTALREVTLDIPAHAVTVFFGPAGGGKTTLLRLINRLNDLVDGTRMSGSICIDGRDIYAPGVDLAFQCLHIETPAGVVPCFGFSAFLFPHQLLHI